MSDDYTHRLERLVYECVGLTEVMTSGAISQEEYFRIVAKFDDAISQHTHVLTTSDDNTQYVLSDSEWTLTPEQFAYCATIYGAVFNEQTGEANVVLGLKAQRSDEYKRLFGDMPIDEAFDRYECMIDDTIE